MDASPMMPDEGGDPLIALVRKTIHEANNELMSIVQECELALLKEDPEILKKALNFSIDRAMAISRLHRETRAEILGHEKRAQLRETDHGHLDRSGGGDQPD